MEVLANSDHKLLSLEVSHLLTYNEACFSASLSPSSPHPLIAHYCLSSSVPFLASFACLTSLDTRVSHFIRFSHSLAPELLFQPQEWVNTIICFLSSQSQAAKHCLRKSQSQVDWFHYSFKPSEGSWALAAA